MIPAPSPTPPTPADVQSTCEITGRGVRGAACAAAARQARTGTEARTIQHDVIAFIGFPFVGTCPGLGMRRDAVPIVLLVRYLGGSGRYLAPAVATPRIVASKCQDRSGCERTHARLSSRIRCAA